MLEQSSSDLAPKSIKYGKSSEVIIDTSGL
jgi:hypothetical protein